MSPVSLSAGPADLIEFHKYAKLISTHLPAADAGSRFARVFETSKKHKMHDFFLFAGPLGAYLVHLARAIKPEQRTAYTLLYLACGDLWEKAIVK